MTEDESTTRPLWLTLLCLCLGLALVSAAAWTVRWNEERAVQQMRRALLESGLVFELDPGHLDPAAEQHLVHAVGPLIVPGTRLDRDFGVAVAGAVRMDRRTEMYQWTESAEPPYRYAPAWSEQPIDSTRFKESGHENPPFTRRDLSIVAPRGVIGGLTVSYDALEQLGPPAPLIPGTEVHGLKMTPTGFYAGEDPDKPAIGDMRITYIVVHPGEVSVLGMLVTGTLRPFDLEGRHILRARRGNVSAAALAGMDAAPVQDPVWPYRAGAALGLLLGFRLLMQPAGALGAAMERRPLLGDVVSTGPFLIALAFTVLSWVLLAAAVWLHYRLWWAAAIIGAGLVLVLLMARIIWARWAWLQPVEYAPTRVREG